MIDEHYIKASTFVTRFVETHVKSRILDGRPDKILVQTLTDELAMFLRSTSKPAQDQDDEQGRPKPRRKNARTGPGL